MTTKRLCISGFSACGSFRATKSALAGMQAIFPTRFSLNVQEYETKEEYSKFLADSRDRLGTPATHTESPLVWFEESNKYLGSKDAALNWLRSQVSLATETEASKASNKNVDAWNKDHDFEYDLVVIGGGSGGMACSQEAKKLGARVAVLDFVKPSPAGSKWGLGGTCVNVGCIPKKLMHTAALLGEHAKDAKNYGWENLEGGVHNWEKMRESVQDHIRSLNFGYRVKLREKGVTYLNKLGRFTGPNTLECTDSKGRTSTITAARFVIATGGRPTPLECPGGDLAINSDDIFMKETAPGKTCVVGAGYVALECAGFLTALRQGDVKVLVRSILLRGFDRDCVGYVEKFMEEHGTKFEVGELPKSIEKTASGKLLVTYGDKSEEFDTVLAAIGRKADLAGLGLDNVGSVEINPKTGKVITHNEQTSVPHVYALGDIVDGGLELTPVAILAGKLLARRLFGVAESASSQVMDYKNIATTVFTPLEMGTVGLSEEAAIAQYGHDNIEVYHSEFTPLEWTITGNHEDARCYAKMVVNKAEENRVVGMHIVCPNAGEVIQGYAYAVKKGATYEEIQNLVGIHPTNAEEFTVMGVSKSSGESVVKTGC